MPDVREVFEMATKTVRPDPGVEGRQHRKQRTHAIRQKAATYTVVAAVLIGATVFGVVTFGADDRTMPAAGGQPIDLTRENLAGVWRTRGVDAASATLLSFGTLGGGPGFALGNRVTPDWLQGTYEIQGDTITLADPSKCQGMKWTARLPEEGVLEITLTGPEARAGGCTAPLGSNVEEFDSFAFERVSPRSPATAHLDTAGRAEEGAPPSHLGDLSGVWLIDNGNKVLWIGSAQLASVDIGLEAEYVISEGGLFVTGRIAVGVVRLEDDGSLVFRSITCAEDNKETVETVWENVLISGDAFAADVPRGACGGLAPGRTSWLRISGQGGGPPN